jgi:hypothetical protein
MLASQQKYGQKIKRLKGLDLVAAPFVQVFGVTWCDHV